MLKGCYKENATGYFYKILGPYIGSSNISSYVDTYEVEIIRNDVFGGWGIVKCSSYLPNPSKLSPIPEETFEKAKKIIQLTDTTLKDLLLRF